MAASQARPAAGREGRPALSHAAHTAALFCAAVGIVSLATLGAIYGHVHRGWITAMFYIALVTLGASMVSLFTHLMTKPTPGNELEIRHRY